MTSPARALEYTNLVDKVTSVQCLACQTYHYFLQKFFFSLHFLWQSLSATPLHTFSVDQQSIKYSRRIVSMNDVVKPSHSQSLADETSVHLDGVWKMIVVCRCCESHLSQPESSSGDGHICRVTFADMRVRFSASFIIFHLIFQHRLVFLRFKPGLIRMIRDKTFCQL